MKRRAPLDKKLPIQGFHHAQLSSRQIGQNGAHHRDVANAAKRERFVAVQPRPRAPLTALCCLVASWRLRIGAAEAEAHHRTGVDNDRRRQTRSPPA